MKYAKMPYEHYENACNAIREKTGDTEPIKSGAMAEQIKKGGRIKITNGDYLFYSGARSEQIDSFDLSELTSAKEMFRGCSGFEMPKDADFSRVTTMEHCFRNANFSDLFPNTDEVVFDIPNCEAAQYAFEGIRGIKKIKLISPKLSGNCRNLFGAGLSTYGLEEVEVDLSNVKEAGNIFSLMKNLRKVKVVFGANCVNFFQFCIGCTNLTTIEAGGVIAANISFQDCPLTAESAISIINCLKDYLGTDKEYTHAVTFSATTKTALEELGAESPNGMTWLEYAESKGWNI